MSFSALVNVARQWFEPAPSQRGPLTDDVVYLGWLLDIAPRELLQFRGAKRDPRFHYRPLHFTKRDGSPRQIYAPSDPLKVLQRALLRKYLNTLPMHEAATGFRRGLSVADNARHHIGQAVVATADIENFFDTTSAHRVRTLFEEQDWDATATSVLTGLCVFRGALPQGAPTSPILSNLVNAPLDVALWRLARQAGARYTRYGDDLTFSWHAARRAPRSMRRDVQRVLLEFGYRLNKRKGWHVWRVHKGEQACITGVCIGRDGELRPRPEVAATIRQLRRQKDPASVQRLRGYDGFVNMLRRS